MNYMGIMSSASHSVPYPHFPHCILEIPLRQWMTASLSSSPVTGRSVSCCTIYSYYCTLPTTANCLRKGSRSLPSWTLMWTNILHYTNRNQLARSVSRVWWAQEWAVIFVSLGVVVIVSLDLSGRLTIVATQVSGPKDPDLCLGGNMNISDVLTYLFHGAESFLKS
jgi:hypothetical protein